MSRARAGWKPLIAVTALIALVASGCRVAGEETLVNATTAGQQSLPATAMAADGHFVVAWESQNLDGDGYGIAARRFLPNGSRTGPEIHVNTYTTGAQISTDVAMDADGDFVVTWASFTQLGQDYEIYAQRFGADGTAAGSEMLVNTTTAGRQFDPEVAMDDAGRFVVVWRGADADGIGVWAQAFAADGTPMGAERLVNTTTQGDQQDPDVAMDADGDIIVTWADRFGGTAHFQHLADDGTPVGSETAVDASGPGQSHPAVAMGGDGDFVVAWETFRIDPSVPGGVVLEVAARWFEADGSPRGPAVPVNPGLDVYSTFPTVAVDDAGNGVVGWMQGADLDVYARQFDGGGTATGDPFLVNTYTTSSQEYPSAAMSEDGRFALSWDSFEQDGNGDSVVSKRYVFTT